MNPTEDERGLRAAGGNKFAFVSMVRNRAHDLQNGSAARVYTDSTKPVSIAITEIACDEMPAVVRSDTERVANELTIVCRVCSAVAVIRRVAGAEMRGRPPSRCAKHGLSANWEEVALK